jgi:hypothetical protein
VTDIAIATETAVMNLQTNVTDKFVYKANSNVTQQQAMVNVCRTTLSVMNNAIVLIAVMKLDVVLMVDAVELSLNVQCMTHVIVRVTDVMDNVTALTAEMNTIARVHQVTSNVNLVNVFHQDIAATHIASVQIVQTKLAVYARQTSSSVNQTDDVYHHITVVTQIVTATTVRMKPTAPASVAGSKDNVTTASVW